MMEISAVSGCMILITIVLIWGLAGLSDEVRKIKNRLDKIEKGVSHNIKEE